MAPVGRHFPSAKGPYSKEEKFFNMSDDDELKEEPPDDRGFHEEVHIKKEDEDDDSSYAAMNIDEGIVIKQEKDDDFEDEEEKPEGLTLDEGSEGSDEEIEKIRNPLVSDAAEDPNKSLKSLLCKVCGKQFFRAFYFNMHIKTHQSSTPNILSSDKPHKCAECGKSFALLQHLTGHSRIHIAGRYYECPVCRRKFTELSNLTMHLLKTHPDEKPYKCPECEKQFTQSSALKKHLRTHSTNISQEEIDRIDKLFFVNDINDKSIDEPLKKKIKLEKDEKVSPGKDKYSPLKEKPVLIKLKSPSVKIRANKSGSLKGKSPSKESSSHPKKSIPSEEQMPVKEESEELPEVKEISVLMEGSAPAKVVLSQDKDEAESSSPSSKCAPVEIKEEIPDDDDFASSPGYAGVAEEESFESIDAAEELPLSLQVADSLPISEENQHSSSVLANPCAASQDTVPQKNGVSIDQVLNPQIRVTKFAKMGHAAENLQPKKSTTMDLPSTSSEGTLDFGNSIEAIESLSHPSMLNHDKSSKEKSTVAKTIGGDFNGQDRSFSKEPEPLLEKPNDDYEERYKCLRCDIFLDSEEKLNDHLMDHTGVKLYDCRFCGKNFTTLTALKRHLYYHVVGSIPQDCTRCSRTFCSFRDLKEHCVNKCDAISNAQFKCFRCKKHTSTLGRLKFHLLSQCNDDPVKHYVLKKSEENLSGASEDHSNHKTEEISNKCTINKECDTSVPEGRTELNQADISTLNLEAEDVDAVQVLSEASLACKGKEDWHFLCQSCGRKLDNPEKAKVHVQLGCDHEIDNNTGSGKEAESEMCKESGKKGDQNSGKECEKENIKIKVVFEEDKDLHCYLSCSECDKKIVGVEKMLLHIREHIIEKNTLTCPVLKCGKLFKDPKEFKLHLKAHTGHKPYKCSDCGKRFFLRENYENHAQRHGVLKHWSSINYPNVDRSGKVFVNTRSPITIESSIINLEVSESDVDRKLKASSNNSPQAHHAHAESQAKENRKDVAPNQSPQKSLSSEDRVKPIPALKRASPTENGHTYSMTKAPLNRPLPALLRHIPIVNRLPSPVSRPTIIRPATISTPTAISGPALLTNGSQAIVSRLAHTSGGSLAVTPQGIFSVGPPRSFTLAATVSSKPEFTMTSVKQTYVPKNPSVRAHPPSYYRLSDHSKANIQASNAELRKYPRSGRCEVCKKICSRLDKHMMVHLNQKPHLCPICPQAFRQSEHLRRHIRARHEGNHRQFECPQCHKRLTRKDKLKEHMKNCTNRFSPLPLEGANLVDSLFEMIPGPSEPPLQGHTTA